MYIKRLYLHHFRNYSETEVSFSPGVNWITGKNGQGKTNLLEALYLLSTGRSFRTHQLSQLIQTDSPFFYLEAEIESEGVRQTLKVSFDGEIKKVHYNATVYSYFAPLLGLLPHVMYAPEDTALIGGAPAFRRKVIDLHLAQIDPLYLHHLARYHKAMRQRNELLKKKIEEAIEPWEMSMAQSGSYLMKKREELIQQLQKPLYEKMLEISSGIDHLGIKYESSLPLADPESLLMHWQKNRKKEFHIGTTLYGPHRDDLIFSIDHLSAKSFASVGQQHSIIAALRLCQWSHLQSQTRRLPFFSVDDFGAHLDESRQRMFQEKLSSLGQIFLTSPAAHYGIFPNKQMIHIDSGKVLEIGSA